MASSTVNINVLKTGLLTGGTESAASGALVNASASDSHTVQAFSANTFAAVTVPTGSTGVLIMPPAANAGTITVKGITGDTGINLHKTNPTFLSLDTSGAFGIVCLNNTTIEFVWT